MKLVNEKLAVAEYNYPYYKKINPIIYSYISSFKNRGRFRDIYIRELFERAIRRIM